MFHNNHFLFRTFNILAILEAELPNSMAKFNPEITPKNGNRNMTDKTTIFVVLF